MFVVLNNFVGDVWIGSVLSVRALEWYRTLVPLPYVAMLAIIHARRTAGSRWLESALLAAVLWPFSTVLVDVLYLRLLYGTQPEVFLDRFDGPYGLLVAGLFALPLVAGWACRR